MTLLQKKTLKKQQKKISKTCKKLIRDSKKIRKNLPIILKKQLQKYIAFSPLSKFKFKNKFKK
jgi:hypothetical protein